MEREPDRHECHASHDRLPTAASGRTFGATLRSREFPSIRGCDHSAQRRRFQTALALADRGRGHDRIPRHDRLGQRDSNGASTADPDRTSGPRRFLLPGPGGPGAGPSPTPRFRGCRGAGRWIPGSQARGTRTRQSDSRGPREPHGARVWRALVPPQPLTGRSRHSYLANGGSGRCPDVVRRVAPLRLALSNALASTRLGGRGSGRRPGDPVLASPLRCFLCGPRARSRPSLVDERDRSAEPVSAAPSGVRLRSRSVIIGRRAACGSARGHGPCDDSPSRKGPLTGGCGRRSGTRGSARIRDHAATTDGRRAMENLRAAAGAGRSRILEYPAFLCPVRCRPARDPDDAACWPGPCEARLAESHRGRSARPHPVLRSLHSRARPGKRELRDALRSLPRPNLLHLSQ